MDKYNTRATIENTTLWETLFVVTKDGKKKPSIRFWRWCSIIGVHLLFFLSYHIDLQMLEGTLSGSRFLGFHLIDPYMTLQVFAAHHEIPTNLIIGTVTIILGYLLLGGRAYCSWVCPYGLIGEIGEKLHKTLVKKKIIKSHPFNHNVKYIFWVLFLVFAFISGYLVFEVFNVVGIISRSIIYGWGVALSFVLAVFLVEVFYSQRAWCRYVCPLGTTYALIGWGSATKIKWDDRCDHCQVCTQVCIVPHVLEITKKNADRQGKKEISIMSGDCTLCGRCVEVCHTDALNFETKLKKLI
ncbi:MAG: NapH/MauN family ferredoxin-type protein [Sulfurospirillaceae bacterium]|nr:NapH/MauN family ferredoxin-type protein [Sulfurospirillaceae bacterium]MCK9545661.1 NapH/MauN family ferredoxin-type protein [Sulfurospirillaceae bacterium]MDY0237997.1 NapH/MauN family ferredoxin-type protein [Campylobacterales bacterium]NLN00133.1 NapH/MauN family ferredoxin-type protein [Campylobacteraceae bacterium]